LRAPLQGFLAGGDVGSYPNSSMNLHVLRVRGPGMDGTQPSL